MKEPYEKGLAIRSAPSFALGAVKFPVKRKQGERWAGYRPCRRRRQTESTGRNSPRCLTGLLPPLAFHWATATEPASKDPRIFDPNDLAGSRRKVQNAQTGQTMSRAHVKSRVSP